MLKLGQVLNIFKTSIIIFTNKRKSCCITFTPICGLNCTFYFENKFRSMSITRGIFSHKRLGVDFKAKNIVLRVHEHTNWAYAICSFYIICRNIGSESFLPHFHPLIWFYIYLILTPGVMIEVKPDELYACIFNIRYCY